MPDELDGELLRRFVQGERDAFESLFRREIEVYWSAYRARARFDPSRSFGAWMRRIATNAARDHLRSARERVTWITTSEDIGATTTLDRGLSESVAVAFRKLPPKLQVVATLALIAERPYAEIADALDVPIGTVKSQVFRAVCTLRKELARLGIRP